MVAHPFSQPQEHGHGSLAVAIALFLIGFFLMINQRKAISQVVALLTAENGLFLAAIALDLWNAADRGSGDLLRCAGGRDDPGHSVLSHRRNLRVDGHQ